MERYVNGEPAAFDELFARYENRAFAYFVRRTRSPDRAQDLYQELFLRVHRARHAYDARRPFAPWFFQVAHRLLIDDQRRAFRSHEVPLDERLFGRSAASAAEAVADREQLVQLLGGLSADERFVVVASTGSGVGHSELARQLGKSTDAVKKMASRSLQRARRLALAPSHNL
jgi:RNA polymerase sigma-70 factor (ECF subfamily)